MSVGLLVGIVGRGPGEEAARCACRILGRGPHGHRGETVSEWRQAVALGSIAYDHGPAPAAEHAEMTDSIDLLFPAHIAHVRTLAERLDNTAELVALCQAIHDPTLTSLALLCRVRAIDHLRQ